eukprot:4553357-Amphidinium_carterae.1
MSAGHFYEYVHTSPCTEVGTVLFLAHLGSQWLTTAVFVSGLSSVVVGQVFSSCSKSRSPVIVNSLLLSIATCILCGLYAVAIGMPADAADNGGVEHCLPP